MTERPRRIVFVAANPSIDRLHEVDSIIAGGINRPDRVVVVPGGKGLNAARAAAALGGDVVAVTLLGGQAGAWIAHGLAALGVTTRAIDAGVETRTCISVLDRATGTLTEFYEPGAPLAPGAFEQFEAAVRAELEMPDVGALAISGSLPPGAPIDGYGRLIHIARDRGVIVMADAHGAALEAALRAGPTLVKVNATEAAAVYGAAVTDVASAARAAESLRAAGARGAVITLGSAGAVASDETEVWRLWSSGLEGTYPVGSGDAFLGGLAKAVADGLPLVEAARLGMAAGIANAKVAGAGVLQIETVERIRPTVEVQGLPTGHRR